MPNIIDLILEGKNVAAKKVLEEGLRNKVSTALDSKKKQVIAETYCVEAALPVKKKVSTSSGSGKTALSPQGFLIRLAQKFGFKHNRSETGKGGSRHLFSHPTGEHHITIHSDSKGAYYAHSKGTKAAWTHMGAGDNHRDLAKHLKTLFPAKSFQSTKKIRKEALEQTFGSELYEAVKELPHNWDPGKIHAAAKTKQNVKSRDSFVSSLVHKKFGSATVHKDPSMSNQGQVTHRQTGAPKHLGFGTVHKAEIERHKASPDIHVGKVDNTDHKQHPFHSDVEKHGYVHTGTTGNADSSSHTFKHPKTGHGVVLKSNGSMHSWGGRNREGKEHISNYLSKQHAEPSPKDAPGHSAVKTVGHELRRFGRSTPLRPPLKTEEYDGFDKLKAKLGHEKGVTDPGGLSAVLGKRKYGSKGFNTHKHGGK